MNSSPRPLRRFSRWKTTKRTFVLGGKAFVSEEKDHKTSDSQDVQKRGHIGTRVRSSPRIPCSKDLSLHSERSNSDSSITETENPNVDYNSEINHLQGSRVKGLNSNNQQAHNELVISTSQALSVLSPNVSITEKDVQVCNPYISSFNIEENDHNRSQSNSNVETNQLDSETDPYSNPNSVRSDKENSTAVCPVQPDRSASSSTPSAEVYVAPGPSKLQDVDEPSLKNSSRRQTLRDRSLLSPSAVLMQKNYPFSQSLSEKSSTEKNSRKKIPKDKHLSISVNISVRGKRKGKVLANKNSIIKGNSDAKSVKKSEKEHNLGHTENKNVQAGQSIALASPLQKKSSKLSTNSETETNLSRSPSLSREAKQKKKLKEKEYREVSDTHQISRGKNEAKSKSSLIKEQPLFEAVNNKKVRGKTLGFDTSPTAQSSDSLLQNSRTSRSLRDRRILTTPQMQYPAEFMSSAQIKSLSNKAKKLLSSAHSTTLPVSQKSISSETKTINSNCSTEDQVIDISKNKLVDNKISLPKNSHSLKPLLNDQPNKLKKCLNQTSKRGPKSFTQYSSSSELRKKVNDESNAHQNNNVRSERNMSPNQTLHLGSDSETVKGKSGVVQRRLALSMKKKGQTWSSSIGSGDVKSTHHMNSVESVDDSPLQDTGSKDEFSMVVAKGNSQKISGAIRKVHDIKKTPSPQSMQRRILPHCSTQNQNETATVPKKKRKSLKRRLFEDSHGEAKKFKQANNRYENGRDVLLWSEIGESRKGSSVTSLDVIFSDVIELDDHLKDSAETDYMQQRLIGKVMGRLKRSLKSQIHQVEQNKELQSDIKKRRDKCKKIKAEILQQEEINKRLERKLLKRKESERISLREWMKNLKTLVRSTRKT